jgi:hypothetical protein
MKRLIAGCAALALLVGVAGRADAGIVYDNGPINGTILGWTISDGYEVSDSFTISSPTTLTEAQVGLWAIFGDMPTSVQWSIGTSAFGNDVSQGTSTLSDTFTGQYGYGAYPLYESTFALTGVLGPGTYWLTLQNATSQGSDPVYWDENNGPSQAMQNTTGAISSESFQLYGSGTAVPEPSTVVLLGIGATGLIGYRWRRSRPAVA